MWQNHSTEVGRVVTWAPLRNRLRMPWVEASSMGRVLYCPPMTVYKSKSEAGVLGFVRRGGEVGEEGKSGRLG